MVNDEIRMKIITFGIGGILNESVNENILIEKPNERK